MQTLNNAFIITQSRRLLSGAQSELLENNQFKPT